MPIITISRGTGSGGQLLAEQVAQRLGFDIVSREEVVHEAAHFGASEEQLHEALLRPPSLWDRFHRERHRYLAFVQAALCERVQNGRAVYHGNAGHLLLPGVAHVVRVRLIAPLDFRIRMVQERSGMTETEARDYVHDVDRQREKWTRFLYGVDWLNPALYDVCVNLGTLEVTDAVELVTAVSRSSCFQPTEESRRAMADLVLSSRVQAALAADERTASAEVSVQARAGVVRLRGRLRPASLADAVIDVAGRVPGVEQVDRDDLAAPDYTV